MGMPINQFLLPAICKASRHVSWTRFPIRIMFHQEVSGSWPHIFLILALLIYRMATKWNLVEKRGLRLSKMITYQQWHGEIHERSRGAYCLQTLEEWTSFRAETKMFHQFSINRPQ